MAKGDGEKNDDVVRLGARVSQVAKVLDAEPAQVMRTLADRSDETYSIASWLSESVVAELLANHAPRKQPADARQYILDSFAAARVVKSDWSTMTLAVLKNRMIATSNGGFDETDYGAPNMPYFVALFEDLLEITQSGIRAAVRLIDVSLVPDTPPAQPLLIEETSDGLRVRSDLWNAIMDYKSRATYVWDPNEQTARRARDGDGDLMIIPTITAAEAVQWREELFDRLDAQLETTQRVALRRWIDSRAGTLALPVQFRSAWNGLQNARVTERLKTFFNEKDVPAPRDLVVPKARSASRPNSAENLRSFLHRCVDAMTEDELASMQINARVALQAGTSRAR